MKRHTVILRDDDTNALTPVECLDRLYRPWLERGLPVNLATIPFVNTSARWKDGSEEGFLLAKTGRESSHLSIADSPELLDYLKSNTGYRIVHHGHAHDYLEFECTDAQKVGHMLDHGRQCFEKAGLGQPKCFVAPYDQISREALNEVAARFEVFSTGWFELRRLPVRFWPAYVLKRLRKQPHWNCGGLHLMSHPGCLLSHKRSPESILPLIKQAVERQSVTVLVTHWWEYFYGGKANEAYIGALHETASWLADRDDIEVIGFDDLAVASRRASSCKPASLQVTPSLQLHV